MNHPLNDLFSEIGSTKTQAHSNINDRILETIHQKLCMAFQTSFLRKKIFEAEIQRFSDSWVNKIKNHSKAYFDLLEKKDKSIINLSKEEYVQNQYDQELFYKHRYENNYGKGTVDSEVEEGISPEKKKMYQVDYDKKLKENDSEVVQTLKQFILNNVEKKDNQEKMDNLFWEFIKQKNINSLSSIFMPEGNFIGTITPEEIVDQFCSDYLSQPYNKLLEIAESYLDDLGLTGFETFIVNVGYRRYNEGRSGWGTHLLSVINNDKRYSYQCNTKDEPGVNDQFINIFILQKKYLVKVSITQNQSEQTKFLIWKDCEKLTIKNEVEVHIAKHHGNETIIFDTRKDALEFQSKILEAKEGGKRPYPKD